MPPPSPDPTILNNLNDREGAPLSLLDFSVPNAPPSPLGPQYCSILMEERGGAIIFCRILASPPPFPDATILNYLDDKERGRHYLCRILAPPVTPPPPPPTPQYLTILMPERGGAIIFCRILAPPPPSSPDATILNYLYDRERGGRQLQYPVEVKYIRILLLIL